MLKDWRGLKVGDTLVRAVIVEAQNRDLKQQMLSARYTPRHSTSAWDSAWSARNSSRPASRMWTWCATPANRPDPQVGLIRRTYSRVTPLPQGSAKHLWKRVYPRTVKEDAETRPDKSCISIQTKLASAPWLAHSSALICDEAFPAMRLFLCEKPSQAKDIAKVLGATRKANGCWQGSDVCVTGASAICSKLPHPTATTSATSAGTSRTCRSFRKMEDAGQAQDRQPVQGRQAPAR